MTPLGALAELRDAFWTMDVPDPMGGGNTAYFGGLFDQVGRALTEPGRGSDGTDGETSPVRQRGTAVPPSSPGSVSVDAAAATPGDDT